MNKENLTQLTNNLYHLTLLFPKKEPLRYKMRELADEILARCLKLDVKPGNPTVLDNLEILDSYFEVAKAQNWVSPEQLLEIQKEYSKIREELEKLEKGEKVETGEEGEDLEKREVKLSLLTNSTRQQRILEILKEKRQAQVWEIKKIFPEVTKRTLRRDFSQLLKQGLIERVGERNETFYQPKSR